MYGSGENILSLTFVFFSFFRFFIILHLDAVLSSHPRVYLTVGVGGGGVAGAGARWCQRPGILLFLVSECRRSLVIMCHLQLGISLLS